ncbi:MAG: hypothetical protein HC902_14705, partial [Calothrix sp. SM1_5_4]|nr:hypothetical protein [Calothrix sp. SM1_5_4]
MAKNAKITRAKGTKKSAAKRASRTAGTDVRNALAQLETEKNRVTRELEERRIRLLQDAIASKKEALTKAEENLTASQKKVDELNQELQE